LVKTNPLDMASSETAIRKNINAYNRMLTLNPWKVIIIFVVSESIRMITNISTVPRTTPKSSPSGLSIEFRNTGFCLSITLETKNMVEKVPRNIAT
jgi:hypothetical protein